MGVDRRNSQGVANNNQKEDNIMGKDVSLYTNDGHIEITCTCDAGGLMGKIATLT